MKPSTQPVAVTGEERKLTCEEVGGKQSTLSPTPTPVQKILNTKTKRCLLGPTGFQTSSSHHRLWCFQRTRAVSARPVLKGCAGHAHEQRARDCSAKLPGSPRDSTGTRPSVCPSQASKQVQQLPCSDCHLHTLLFNKAEAIKGKGCGLSSTHY